MRGLLILIFVSNPTVGFRKQRALPREIKQDQIESGDKHILDIIVQERMTCKEESTSLQL